MIRDSRVYEGVLAIYRELHKLPLANFGLILHAVNVPANAFNMPPLRNEVVDIKW